MPVLSIFDRVRRIVVEQLNVAPEKVTPEAKITDDLGADSVDQVELIMALEDEFEITIEDGDAQKVETIQQAVELIERLAAA